MPRQTKVIRDFLYMDLDRLYSLYSQVFEALLINSWILLLIGQAALIPRNHYAILAGRCRRKLQSFRHTPRSNGYMTICTMPLSKD